jgi:hypothetical protein
VPGSRATQRTIPVHVAAHSLALLFNCGISFLFGSKLVAPLLPLAHRIPNVPPLSWQLARHLFFYVRQAAPACSLAAVKCFAIP